MHQAGDVFVQNVYCCLSPLLSPGHVLYLRLRRLRYLLRRAVKMQGPTSRALFSIRPLLTPKRQPATKLIRLLCNETHSAWGFHISTYNTCGTAWRPATPPARHRHPGLTSNIHTSGQSRQEAAFESNVDKQQEDKQARTPWHREGSDTPPVARQHSAGAMTQGQILSYCRFYIY